MKADEEKHVVGFLLTFDSFLYMDEGCARLGTLAFCARNTRIPQSYVASRDSSSKSTLSNYLICGDFA